VPGRQAGPVRPCLLGLAHVPERVDAARRVPSAPPSAPHVPMMQPFEHMF
jgi:hypothetical protein